MGRAAEAPDDEGVAAAQVGEGRGQPRPVGTGAGSTILEDLLPAERGKGIPLKVEPLVLGRDPRIADQHAGSDSRRRGKGRDVLFVPEAM